MRLTRRNLAGFTLVEMMVVVAVIGIMAGMVFKMMIYATRQSYKAQTMAILEQVAHALNEYKAEYGQYPPVTFVEYEFENVNSQSPFLRNRYLGQPEDWEESPTLFRLGLVSHLMVRDVSKWPSPPRPSGFSRIEHMNSNLWQGDTARDEAAKKRWEPFLVNDNVIALDPNPPLYQLLGEAYWNYVATILDGWDRTIHYVSEPPYQTYRLWSKGPDGKSGTADDIHADRME